MTTESFTLPPDLTADDGVLMDADFQQMALDAMGCFYAVGVLISLLRGDSPDFLDPQDRQGLALLLGGVHQRLELLAVPWGCKQWQMLRGGDERGQRPL